MKIEIPGFSRRTVCLVLLCSLQLAGCASVWRSRVNDDAGPAQALAYYQLLSRMGPAEVGRERMVLAALPHTPHNQLRTAMLLGHPRGTPDFGRALGLLDGLLKSSDAAAVPLQPLARVLADNYSERQRLESQQEKMGGLLKESQRKSFELQEKIEGLAEIERSLKPRSSAPGSRR